MKDHTETYFVVKRFKELTEADALYDPYHKHQFVAGHLYYDMVEEELELVPFSRILCHLACTPFESSLIESKCVHTLPLDQVDSGLLWLWSVTMLIYASRTRWLTRGHKEEMNVTRQKAVGMKKEGKMEISSEAGCMR